jgi:hypothetical protein
MGLIVDDSTWLGGCKAVVSPSSLFVPVVRSWGECVVEVGVLRFVRTVIHDFSPQQQRSAKASNQFQGNQRARYPAHHSIFIQSPALSQATSKSVRSTSCHRRSAQLIASTCGWSQGPIAWLHSACMGCYWVSIP